jgi:hypothetical protein
MNFNRIAIAELFGKALTDQIAGSAVSTNGLQRFTTKALLAELERRTEQKEPEPAEAKVDSWLPIDEITEKYFKGVASENIGKYLAVIGHPYRLQPKMTNANFSVRKIFLEDTMKAVAEAFDRTSRKLDCDGSVGIWIHPFVGRYERTGCTCKWDLA